MEVEIVMQQCGTGNTSVRFPDGFGALVCFISRRVAVAFLFGALLGPQERAHHIRQSLLSVYIYLFYDSAPPPLCSNSIFVSALTI